MLTLSFHNSQYSEKTSSDFCKSVADSDIYTVSSAKKSIALALRKKPSCVFWLEQLKPTILLLFDLIYENGDRSSPCRTPTLHKKRFDTIIFVS